MKISFRSKIGFSVGLFTLLISGGSLFYLYWKIYNLVWTETQDKLKSIGKIGIYLFHKEQRENLKSLITKIREK
ncbi:MAG: hypothetical protein KDK36_05300 [Leptospiraceae bacterium]|nr:hypothetical protein [Leptospiraceae bacterium]